MNISFNNLYNRSILFVEGKLQSSLNPQQQKIFVIASLAFITLATVYLISRCCLSPKRKRNIQKPIINEPVPVKLNNWETKTDANGIKLEGEFQNDVLQGKGKKSYPDGLILEGDFRDGLLHGKGKMTHPDRTMLEGDFQNGELNGKGMKTYPDGLTLEGDFRDGLLHGKGKLIKPDGTILEGDFQNGECNGKGKKIYTNGRILEGEFENNQLKQGKITWPQWSNT